MEQAAAPDPNTGPVRTVEAGGLPPWEDRRAARPATVQPEERLPRGRRRRHHPRRRHRQRRVADRPGRHGPVHRRAALGRHDLDPAPVGLQRGGLPLHPLHRRADLQRLHADEAGRGVLGLVLLDPRLHPARLARLGRRGRHRHRRRDHRRRPRRRARRHGPLLGLRHLLRLARAAAPREEGRAGARVRRVVHGHLDHRGAPDPRPLLHQLPDLDHRHHRLPRRRPLLHPASRRPAS